jgi:hypothetical protein
MFISLLLENENEKTEWLSLNPGTFYKIEISNANYYINNEVMILDSQLGHD